eukprot:scaffold207_cov409-Prasinococcus_capsulatus_cf.AAC.26
MPHPNGAPILILEFCILRTPLPPPEDDLGAPRPFELIAPECRIGSRALRRSSRRGLGGPQHSAWWPARRTAGRRRQRLPYLGGLAQSRTPHLWSNHPVGACGSPAFGRPAAGRTWYGWRLGPLDVGNDAG